MAADLVLIAALTAVWVWLNLSGHAPKRTASRTPGRWLTGR